MNRWIIGIIMLISLFLLVGWGFHAHRQINRLAVFTLPPEMIGFYKANIGYLTEASVNADRRRFAVVDEAPRHYIDIDHFGDSAIYTMPRYWKEAVDRYGEDTLKAYGILPWHINVMYYRLKDAFLVKDPARILSLSADLGHYLADAHVPLHTTENYNGQYTGQEGIHAFWESRLPELFSAEYDFFIGKATYIKNPQLEAWKIIERTHQDLKDVLQYERQLTTEMAEKKYSFETRGKQTIKVYSYEFSKAYHEALNGMVERQMRSSIKAIGDFWYTAWVDAGQPDLKTLINYKPTEAELAQRRKEVEEWKQQQVKVRVHEVEN
ncbi:MAG TPA: zinc dependent phospholipase C family protein [Cyclobacteriaceae bacterium]|nr:zinc dependent phospholipase C family protein [Cyclobacteriaceae bacterium]HRJ82937.1 zinc dependent phospholipase C family protein [Cyclobacteriaceae bacterium]